MYSQVYVKDLPIARGISVWTVFAQVYLCFEACAISDSIQNRMIATG